MKISVIICTRNRAAFLSDTLGSLARTRIPDGWTVELVLVDNGSTDATRETAFAHAPAGMPLRYRMEPTPGLSHARNAAVRTATGDVLLFTDDDVRVPHNWIAPMADPIVMGTADAVAGGVVLAPPLRRPWMTPDNTQVLAETTALDPACPRRMVGANMAVGRHVFNIVPGFDDELGAGPNALGFGEETLLSYQLRMAGFRLVSAFDVEVEHHPAPDRLTRTAFLAAAEKQGRVDGYLDYHWRHRPWTFWRARLYASLAKAHLRLHAGRLRNPRATRRAEGMDGWEIEAVAQIHRVRYLLAERGRPRKYTQFGLTKHSPPVPTTPTRAVEAVV